MQNISEIEELIKLISKLPGLGPKSAKRIVLKLINNKDELIKPMANILAKVYKNITRCNSCGSIKSNIEGCKNCENISEKFDKICVVEDIADQWSIENSNIFKGYFHILGGTIASVGQRKEELLINSLVERVNRDSIEEVILATSASIEVSSIKSPRVVSSSSPIGVSVEIGSFAIFSTLLTLSSGKSILSPNSSGVGSLPIS